MVTNGIFLLLSQKWSITPWQEAQGTGCITFSSGPAPCPRMLGTEPCREAQEDGCKVDSQAQRWEELTSIWGRKFSAGRLKDIPGHMSSVVFWSHDVRRLIRAETSVWGLWHEARAQMLKQGNRICRWTQRKCTKTMTHWSKMSTRVRAYVIIARGQVRQASIRK